MPRERRARRAVLGVKPFGRRLWMAVITATTTAAVIFVLSLLEAFGTGGWGRAPVRAPPVPCIVSWPLHWLPLGLLRSPLRLTWGSTLIMPSIAVAVLLILPWEHLGFGPLLVFFVVWGTAGHLKEPKPPDVYVDGWKHRPDDARKSR
jgi:hypothetical protein